MRQINERGLALVKAFEGCKLTAYLCPAGVWTIGYGSTGAGIGPGMKISQSEADERLFEDLDRFEQAVERLAPAATDNQFAAMTSLSFNIGISAFTGSTVLKRHKLGNHVGAANAFTMWVRGGGKILPGLVRRREAERKLYLA